MDSISSQITISDIIEIAGIIVSLFVSIVSIAIAVLSLRQNNKMLEESTRPYIVASYEVFHHGNKIIYLVIKNHGSTGALITEFNICPKSSKRDFNERSQKLAGFFLAPGQIVKYEIDPNWFSSDTLRITLKYHSETRSYFSEQDLKIKIGLCLKRNHDDITIPTALQEISERLI